ncbi:MAG: hypothetical protein ACRDTR_10935 [Rubrobacter sp.]
MIEGERGILAREGGAGSAVLWLEFEEGYLRDKDTPAAIGVGESSKFLSLSGRDGDSQRKR